MADYTTSVTRIQDLVGNHSDATAAVVGRFYNNRHRALMESHFWSRAKQEILIVIVADESTGTFSVTNGSSTATSSGASLSSADVGKYIRFADGDDLYTVKSVSSPDITLGDLNGTTVNFQGTTASAATYKMFKRWYSLGAAIESILSVVHGNNFPVTEIPWEYLNEIDPGRRSTGSVPRHFARGPRDQSGTSDLVQIEFWPRLTAATVIRAAIRKGHTDLSGTTNPIVPSGPLEWFGAVDTCYHLYAKRKDPRYLALAKEYAEQAAASLMFEMGEDNKKFGLLSAVRDVGGGVGLENTDFALSRDVGIL